MTLTAAVALAACGGGGDAEPTTTTAAPTTTTSTTIAPTTTVRRTTTTTAAPTTTTEVEVLRMPLNGVPVESADQIPNRPALAVKIDNNPVAQPQAGLNHADIVFEENVEYRTRFAAVFHSDGADPLGPIRSGRSQDVDMLGAFHQPLFAWSGGNANVRRMISDSDMVNLDAGFTAGYYRRSGRGGAPHNLYSSTDALWLHAPPDFEVPTQVFSYLDPGAEFEGRPATIADVKMKQLDVRWTYDPETQLYYRAENGREHLTEDAGQVAATTVIVMAVNYRPSAADARSPEAQTLGTGPLFVFSQGEYVVGKWIHLDRSDPFGLVGAGDEIIEIPPGRVWVELPQDAENFVVPSS